MQWHRGSIPPGRTKELQITIHHMLDQSFSAHNFDTIYSLENRKGSVDIKMMPAEYQDLVDKIKECRAKIKELKQKEDEISIAELATKQTCLKQLQQDKTQCLLDYLTQLSIDVNKPSFRFNLSKFLMSGKELFTIDTTTHAAMFAVKQLQYNIRQIFKVKQADRHFILTNIKTFLNSKIPVYVIRTDINSFFESIPQDRLLKMVLEDSLLNHKSKAFVKGIIKEYESIKDATLVPTGKGVPRGVGISSYLSELYMRNLDRTISNRSEVLYFARYVDDIFIILNSLPIDCSSLNDYYNHLLYDFKKEGLDLKPKDDPKCQLLDIYKKSDVAEITFDYLGYKFKLARKINIVSCRFALKDDKYDEIKTRIGNAFKHFEHLSVKNVRQAYQDLIDSLNYIADNIRLRGSKTGVKVGLYYSHDLLDDFGALDQLTAELRGFAINPYNKLQGNAALVGRLQAKVNRIDFKQRWIDRKLRHYPLTRIQEMEGWL